MTKLKPCPKCHSEDCKFVNEVDNDPRIVFDFWRVRCLYCGVVSGAFDTKEAAIKSWNTRAPDPRLLKAIEEIESILQLKADSAIQGEFTDGFDSGLKRAVYLLKRHIPEVKDE